VQRPARLQGLSARDPAAPGDRERAAELAGALARAANRARRSYPRGLAALAPAGQGGTRADRHVYSYRAVRHAVVDDHRRSPRPDARVPAYERTAVHGAVRGSERALVTGPRARKRVVAGLMSGAARST